MGKCPVCRKPVYRTGKHLPHCSARCKRQTRRHLLFITLTCDECGGPVKRRRSLQKVLVKRGYRFVFCGRPCLGMHMAKVGGFGVHPKNALFSLKYKGIGVKHDWEKVWSEHLRTGFGALRLSRLLAIPEGTVSAILHDKRLSTAKAPGPVAAKE